MSHPLGDAGRRLAARWRQREAAPVSGGDGAPLSFSQAGIWLFEQVHPGTAVNNLTFCGLVDGELDLTALAGAVRTVCRRHEILRTTFVAGDSPRQVVHPDVAVEPRVVDLTGGTEGEAIRRARAAAGEPFDLAAGPLLRITVYRLPAGRCLLTVTAHHLIADGWSLGVFLGEVSAGYSGASLGKPPGQYADVARRQHGTPVDTTYWRDRLRDQEPLRLPTDRPRAAKREFRGAAVPVHIGPEVAAGIRALAADTGATPYMVLLSAFQVLLGRLSGQTDVTVGSPTAMRQRASAPRVIGPLINMLALRTDLSGTPTFTEALHRVRQTCLEAYAHQDVPFEKLVEQLQRPLFQAMFVHQAAPAELRLGDLPVTPVAREPSAIQHDLELYLWSGGQEVTGFLGYDADLFTGETAGRIAERFVTLLSAVVADPDRLVSDLPASFTGEAELLDRLSQGDRRPVPDLLVHQWFEAQADRTPDAVAVRATDGNLTYRQLDQRANQLAHHLRDHHRVGPETLVGVCLPRTRDLIVALLAVLKAGAGYVPIDPAYPPARIDYILNDANATALIDHMPEVGHHPTTRLNTPATSDNVAYVIYTSGSTGQPKGVVIEHRQTTAMIAWALDRFSPTELSNVLASTSICFDLSVYEIFGPLAVGGTITLAEHNALDLTSNPALGQGITLINTVPSVAQELLTAQALPPTASTINLAGEPLPPTLVRALYDQPQVGAVRNLYGPSEDTTYSTHAHTSPADQRTPIGRPIHNTHALVLGSDLRPVPLGAFGELYLGGAGVTRGYHQRPSLTAERYLPDPTTPGGRLYRTGDLVRWRPDGQLDYHGRTDHQVKHHGHRIEPGEIEATLLAHPDIRDAAVTIRNDTLTAYIVAPDLDDDPTPLRADLAKTLPSPMIPTAWVFLDALPRTPNRKLDRAALPDPTPTSTTDFEAPRTPTEQLIATVWQSVLDIKKISIHDNFFTLGGHSLLATRIANRLQHPVQLLFQHPTIAELATALPSTADIADIPSLPRFEDNGRVTLPASFGQERLWFLSELDPQAHLAYHMIGGATLHGPLNTTALQHALDTTIQRHEVLRTTLHHHDGTTHQIIHTNPETGLTHIDLTGQPDRLPEQLNHQALDLTEGPLFRATLAHLGHHHHALIIRMHHAISDGWSLNVLLRDISTHYHTNAQLPPLKIQYADFAQWQRNRRLEPHIAYWREQLAGVAPLEFPTDLPRPPRQTFTGAACSVHIGQELTERLQDIARTEGVTEFMVLLAAYQVLLGTMSGQDDFAIGAPVAGREHPDVEDLIGFFANTLVLRADLGGTPTFREVLSRVRQTCLDAYAHQDVPFEKLVEELQPERDLARSPLFQAMLVHQDTPLPTLDLEGVDCDPLWPEQHTSQFDLTLRLEHTTDGLRGELVYNTDLFESVTAHRVAERYAFLVDTLTTAPDTRIVELPALPSDEAELSNGKVTATPHLLVHQWFEAQADRTPDAVAVRAADGNLTYRQLDQRANQLAHHLRDQHRVGPESRVGVCLPRTRDLIVTLLAVLKTGAAYVPIDPAYPRDRIDYLLDDASATTLIDHKPEVAQPITRLDTPATPTNVAYVIYTSGSTGQPKGVVIEHRQTTAMIAWALDTFTPNELRNVLASTSVCFDLSVYEIFVPLAMGGIITLAEHNALDLISNPALGQGVTLINTVPSIAQELLTTQALPTSAATINLAGEPLPPTLVRALYDQPHITAVHNLYGPSEDTTYSTHARTTPADHRTPIGHPIHNTHALVLDPHLRPVPLGAIGELYLGGAGVTRGYHQRPGLTAERYLPDPTTPGGRLYGTGDLVRWRPDGQLDYHGRTDHQVKHHGHRIEPGEIEAALLEYPDIRDAAVAIRNDILTAYVVAPDVNDDPTPLHNHLRTTLPTPMVPTAWVFLDALPRTPNRKLDRAALPDPTPTSTTDFEAPRTPTERLIATVWQSVLDIKKISIHDNFFTIGGHSLLATRIANRLQLPLHILFQHPTIAELANEIATGEHAAIVSIPQLPRVEENGRVTLPASFGQERLWFLSELDPQAHLAYHMIGGATLHGPLNTTALQHALDTTIQRHEVLRTTLHHHDGTTHQIIHTNPETGLTHIDLTGQPDRLPEQLNHQALDLTEGPLFRATLAHLGHHHHALIIRMHHAISDGWSLNVLLRDITTAYATRADLPPLPIQYADFAQWQRNRELEPQLAYWRKQLAGTTPLELPTDLPRPPRQTFTGATCPVEVDAELGAAIDELAKAEGVTVFMLLLAAFQTLLARISGQQDIAVGSPVAGRQHPDVEDLIGFFANTLVLRTDLEGAPTFREMLSRVRQTCLDAYAHQDVPFEKLVEELQPERDLARSPLFQAMFILDETGPRHTMPDLEIEELRPEQRSSQFELTLRLAHKQDGLSGELIYNTDLFTADTAHRLSDRYLTLLSAVVTNPDQLVGELPVMSTGEAERVAKLSRGEVVEVPDLLVHQWFEAQADRTPDAVAVRAMDGELTYRQLDNRANQLAHQLRDQYQVGPETLVGVCLPRTRDLIVTLLAVLKTGAGYVPIDPDYPPARIDYILTDANAKTVITAVDIDNNAPTTRLDATVTPHNVAYVIYTSGSTGQPKGVVIEHRQTTAMIAWARTAELRNVLASTSICFDLSVYEVFAPLAVGGTITLAEHNALDLIPNPALGEDVTLINTVPSIAQELLTAQALPTSAATINLAGEPLSPTLVRALYDQPHVDAVHNLYGPSEDTTYSTHAHTDPADQRTPIGHPIHNTHALVLDAALRPVPLGTIGELYLGGLGVTRGYHQRPALTAERYLPDPTVPGGRLYRTGDLVRWRPDGQLDYHGRTDHQVKHHGHRIEPGEIEATLLEHPQIHDAVVVIKNDTLTAYVVAPDLDEDPAALRADLAETLPSPMIPTAWVFLDTLPRTPNRKLDRAALPDPTPSSTTAFEPPRTDTERLIATVWQSVLDIKKISIHDNFFTLGGHSLLATRITNRLQVPLHLLFQHPTIAQLATALPGAGNAETASIPRLKRTPRTQQPKD